MFNFVHLALKLYLHSLVNTQVLLQQFTTVRRHKRHRLNLFNAIMKRVTSYVRVAA